MTDHSSAIDHLCEKKNIVYDCRCYYVQERGLKKCNIWFDLFLDDCKNVLYQLENNHFHTSELIFDKTKPFSKYIKQ